MSSSNFPLRSIARTARTFDGTTAEVATGYVNPSNVATSPLTTSWSYLNKVDGTNPVGSWSTRMLGSIDGRRPLAVWFRLVGDPTNESLLNLRSGKTADVPAGYAPTGHLQKSYALKTTWTGPIYVGPTDQVCPVHMQDTNSTIEYQSMDAAEAAQLGLLDDFTNAPGDEDHCCEVSSITITEDTTLEPWVGTLFVYIDGPLGATTTATFPEFADIGIDQRAVVVRAAGSGPAFVKPATGEDMNFATDGIVQIQGSGGSIFDRRETTWTSTEYNVAAGQTLQIVNTGDLVVVADPSGENESVRVEATNSGFVRLPSIINWPLNTIIPITRNGGTGQIVITPFVGQSLNGEVNGQFFLGWKDVALAVKTPFGVVVVGSTGSRPIRSLTASSNVTLDFFGDAILVTATQAAAQVITMPSSVGPIMPGARARFVCKGAGGLTINGNGANIAPGSTGAAAATLVIATGETTDLVWNGATEWVAVGNA